MTEEPEVKIGGIGVTPFISMDAALDRIVRKEGVVPGFAVAINPEKVMAARNDNTLKEKLNSATFRYPDGIGVVMALRQKGQETIRIPGCELWEAIMQRAGSLKTPVFLVGSKPEVLEETEVRLESQYGVVITGKRHGYFTKDQELGVIHDIVASGAKIVTVAMGSPKQEEFISKCCQVDSSLFLMGVGGTYDVFVGNVARAPKWAASLNIEWLYRLIRQPKRLWRQRVLIYYFGLLLTRQL